MTAPTPEALRTAQAVFTQFQHDSGMPGWIWHRQATPDNVELVVRFAQALTEQAQATWEAAAQIADRVARDKVDDPPIVIRNVCLARAAAQGGVNA